MKHLVCSNMWNHIGLNVAQQNITHCCKMIKHPLSIDDLKTLDGELNRVQHYVDQKTKFIETNKFPETCVKCSTTWPNSVWKSWNKWKDKDWTQQELDNLIISDKTRNIDIFLSTTCNLACTYCDELYSSRWAELKGLPRTEDDKWRQLMLNNLYKYIEKYHADGVREDRMTYNFLGGEPLLNLEIFDVLEHIASLYNTPSKQVHFNITTNLCVKPKVIENLLKTIEQYRNFTWIISPSIDAVGKRGEDIRDGLDFGLFASNLNTLNNSSLVDSINMQPALNCMSVAYYSKLIDWFATVFDPAQFGKKWTIRNNSVLGPIAMSVNVLPDNYKQYIDKCIKSAAILSDGVDKQELLNHLETVRNNIGTRRDEKAKKIVHGFFTRQGDLKNKNYFEIFPELKDILE